MRVFLLLLVLVGSTAFGFAAESSSAVSGTKIGRVIKVLPFLLDAQGRDSTSPSLFDRDAYQAQLRERTNEVSGVRVDVQWKAVKSAAKDLKIRVELRGIGRDGAPKLKNFETKVTAGIFSRWTTFKLTGDDFKNFGLVVAWRATLWNHDQLVGEQKSFLW